MDQRPENIAAPENGGIRNITDSIVNADRYYNITEYLYSNYKPLCTVMSTQVWCLNEKWEEYDRLLDPKIKYSKSENINTIHYLGSIPFIWANYDKKEISGYKLYEDPEEADRSNGNYIIALINANDDVENYPLLIDYENGDTESYIFDLQKGRNYYKIRVSTSYAWYTSKVKNISSGHEDGVTAEFVSFAAEDKDEAGKTQ